MKSFLKFKSLACAALLLFIISGSCAQASNENIRPDSWVYPALRTFELKGLIVLPTEKPYSRKQIEDLLDRILQGLKDGEKQLSPRQRFLLSRLRKEFQGKEHRPGSREDPPVHTYKKAKNFMAFDLVAGSELLKDPDEPGGELHGFFHPDMLFSTGSGMTYHTTYRLRIEPEEGRNRPGLRPSGRLRSFRGMTSEFERGYVKMAGGRWGLTVGRDYIHWGSSRDEGLIMSLGAGSLDHFSFYYRLGIIKLTMLHSLLDSSMPRRLAGHRLSLALPADIHLGISETVLYTGRTLDHAYLLPAGSFYANQYNERADDNILWSLDWKIPVKNRFVFYGEFLIDDFQYEGRGTAPDRTGANLAGEALFTAGGVDIEVMADYTYIDIFTYAHKDSIYTRYVTGDGDPEMNRLIGSRLGPDSDRWRLRLSAAVHPRLLLSAEGVYSRFGEGNDLREWDRQEEPNPKFPSGTVIEVREFSLGASLDMGKGSFISAGIGLRETESGRSENDGFGYLKLLLDI